MAEFAVFRHSTRSGVSIRSALLLLLFFSLNEALRESRSLIDLGGSLLLSRNGFLSNPCTVLRGFLPSFYQVTENEQQGSKK